MSDSISITIEERKVEVTVLTPTLTQINLLKPVLGTAPTAQNMGDVIAGADEKATPIGADSLGLSDSEDGDIIKKWTIFNLLNFLVTAFDFLYQPLSTALSKITESGGLPFWDGAPWPGGGGGGEWEVVESRPMSGNALELFTVGADDAVKIVLSGVRFASSGASFMTVGLSIDAGVSYPNTHRMSALENTTASVSPHGQGGLTGTSFWIYDAFAVRQTADGEIIFTGITDATSITMARRFNYLGSDLSGSVAGQMAGGGVFGTTGAVNKIKVANFSGLLMVAGTITLLKRTY